MWDENGEKNRIWRGVVLRERQQGTKRQEEGGAWLCLRIEAVL